MRKLLLLAVLIGTLAVPIYALGIEPLRDRAHIVHNAIISNGIGTINPPLRFFARPEIVLIRLRRQASADGF